MGHQLFEFTPDIIVSGKGLGGGYVPMGGVYTRPDVVAPIAETDLALMFYTFAGHDLGCAVSKKVLQIMREENLVNQAFEMGARLRAKLARRIPRPPSCIRHPRCGTYAWDRSRSRSRNSGRGFSSVCRLCRAGIRSFV